MIIKLVYILNTALIVKVVVRLHHVPVLNRTGRRNPEYSRSQNILYLEVRKQVHWWTPVVSESRIQKQPCKSTNISAQTQSYSTLTGTPVIIPSITGKKNCCNVYSYCRKGSMYLFEIYCHHHNLFIIEYFDASKHYPLKHLETYYAAPNSSVLKPTIFFSKTLINAKFPIVKN